MSLTLKLSSLFIRTLSKPIANRLKAQAREHERFRRMCVSLAQALHRFDMRLRLGAIRDTTAAERKAAKDAADAAVKKLQPTAPTVKTEAEAKAEEAAAAKAKEAALEAEKQPPKPRIRPLSESKAIDSGANFISETFLFLVAGGTIVFETWRSRRKESTRREDVESRLSDLEESEKAARKALVALEREILELKGKNGTAAKDHKRILPREVWEVEEKEEKEEAQNQSWLSYVTSFFSFGQSQPSGPESANQASETSKSVVDKLSPHSPVPVAAHKSLEQPKSS
ncbi:hypothetical protein DTO021C3_7616 [Paecilomyces variotii]|nr:hypothetical protein DTO021C3_7616 [Paecilomyces variotii]